MPFDQNSEFFESSSASSDTQNNHELLLIIIKLVYFIIYSSREKSILRIVIRYMSYETAMGRTSLGFIIIYKNINIIFMIILIQFYAARL